MHERPPAPTDDPHVGGPAAPNGFGPIFRSSPVLDRLGGFVSRGAGAALEVGLVVDVVHTNSRGTLHGGVAATLADCGMGYLLAYATEPPQRLVTVSLTVDFVAPVHPGDFVQVFVEHADGAGRLVHVAGRLQVGDRVAARLRGLYTRA